METQGNRKLMYIVASIVGVVLIFIAGWFFLSKSGTGELGSIIGEGLFQGSEDAVTSTDDQPGSSPTRGGDGGGAIPLFFQITDYPVAGATFVTGGASSTSHIRLARRDTGHIFDVGREGGETTEVANTTIPQLYEVIFLNEGNSMVYRYLEQFGSSETVVTRLGTLQRMEEKVTTRLLSDNISEITASTDQNKLIYVLPLATGSSVNSVNVLTGEVKEIMKSAYREWLPYHTERGLMLSTKASSNVPGYTYVFRDGSQYERVIGKKNGLLVLPNKKGDRLLFSENLAGSLVLGIKGISKARDGEGEVTDERPFSVSGAPDKCVWQKDGIHVICATFSTNRNSRFPDDWYMGKISLGGTFWRINVETEEVEFLADPTTQDNLSFDAIKLFLSDDEKILYFMNKTDGTLWGMRIPEPLMENNSGEQIPAEDTKDYQGSL